MSDTLYKLRPDRDLQCYFYQPSAIAALSGASETGFTVSGSFRQQFDWAVLEWNRDNVFEHPMLRNLPDGNLNGLLLSYQETRTGCIGMDSTWYPTVDWPYLRLWATSAGTENVYQVPLLQYSTAVGTTTPATVQFELQGTITAGDSIELAWLDQHYNYQVTAADTLTTAAAALAGIIQSFAATGLVNAASSGSQITLTYLGMPGSNGNRVGAYGTVSGAVTESWSPSSALFSGGVSPETWQVSLDFSNLTGYLDTDTNHTTPLTVPTTIVRKLRWTWAADVQPASYQRTEFSAVVTGWTVSGTGLSYSVAGPGSRRIEDSDTLSVTYLPNATAWTSTIGNYSGGSIQEASTTGASIQCSYAASGSHTLYLGTRLISNGAEIVVQVDGGAPVTFNLALSGEDVLVRTSLGELGAGTHTVTATHNGPAGNLFDFDFLELAVPTTSLPTFSAMPITTAATDWDTEHSQNLAPERTAWLIDTLGFRGRANHYAGALWFYELVNSGNIYASATVTFSGTPFFGDATQINLGGTLIQHANLEGDTAASIATCFALLINEGSTGVWAQASGAVLTITARALGTQGDSITLAVTTGGGFTATYASALAGGYDGIWLTDLSATPRLNRAARDWSVSFFQALLGYGIIPTGAFSMELGNGDDTTATGIAQRYPDGTAVWVNTPALQTNFSPASLAFWQQAYFDLATLMVTAGCVPYLQFGEVQWWYTASTGLTPSGMPFYDAYTTTTFQATYGTPMAVIPSQNSNPSDYPNECILLPSLIGQFTSAIRAFVKLTYPTARFEVLYPPDVNDTALNQIVNYPAGDWIPANLACLKTENFTYTGDRNLNLARSSINLPSQNGFPASKSSHLVGVGDYTTPWLKEWSLSVTAGDESVVLFALDQFCLIGYPLPLGLPRRRAWFQG